MGGRTLWIVMRVTLRDPYKQGTGVIGRRSTEALSSLPSGVLWIFFFQAFTLLIRGQTRGAKKKPVPYFGKGNILAGLPTLE